MLNAKKKDQAQESPGLPDPVVAKREKRDYDVGYGCPPAHSQFKKGQSGNPKGRTKGRRNINTELKGIVGKQITVRDGQKKWKLSLPSAIILAHGIKAASGDVRSADLFLKHLQNMGLLNGEDDKAAGVVMRGKQQGALSKPDDQSHPSDRIIQNLDLDLLSRTEQNELSRLAEVIDLGGDTTALSTAQFERLKHIVEKGRGKDITPQ